MVLCIRSEKKMVRSDARRGIALMANLHSFWDRSKVLLPRIPMCPNIPSANSEASVAFKVSYAIPRPTVNSLFNVRPKSFYCSPVHF